MRKQIIKGILSLSLFFLILAETATGFSYPLKITDAEGKDLVINKKPTRVVSLVPGITEIIFYIGADDALKGVTYHSKLPCGISKKPVVGGFFSPSLEKIEKLEPDIIFYSGLQKKVKKRFSSGKYKMINLKTESLSDSYKNIIILGRIFDRNKEAHHIVEDIKTMLKIVNKKISVIPEKKRKRVIRLMGRSEIKTPGDDSFQNDMIKAAGGIPPNLGKKGSIVKLSKKEWISFNPQVIYGCGGDRAVADIFFNQPGWKDVDAVKNGKIFYFPCYLTCRAATKTGKFITCLSARIYADEFARKENLALEEKIFKTRDIDIDLEYIENSRIAYSNIYDFINKTLIIDFKIPLSTLSTLEGYRENIKSVGNHYSPPPSWGIGHKHSLKELRSEVSRVIKKNEQDTSLLFTGADMDNLSKQKRVFKDITVYALVTAGVKSNAVRMSRDTGNYYEPGTINMLILSNMKLSKRAMTRAIISATEAKTAALTDMDIRSSYLPLEYGATGTGTDNIIVIQGAGPDIDNAGGHSKMGELIAMAVYAGVKEAVCKQNGITVERNIFQRLDDRKISSFKLISGIDCDCDLNKSEMGVMVEAILLDPVYAGFLESALDLSDDYENGLIKDLSSFEMWCKDVAIQIAGKEFKEMKEFLESDEIPVVLKMALNAVLNGAYYKTGQ